MKTYLFNIIPKLQQYSEKLDNTALLTSQHWVVIDEHQAKVTYIFRPNNDLLISHEGQVQKSKWEYLGNQTMLIDRGDKSYLFKHGFFNEHVLALKVDGRDEYALLVTEIQFEKGINSLHQVTAFLDSYLRNDTPKQLDPASSSPSLTSVENADGQEKPWVTLAFLAALMVLIAVLLANGMNPKQ